MPKSRTAGSYGNSIFSFWGTSILFSIVVVPIHTPWNSVGGFSFLHTLSSICYFWHDYGTMVFLRKHPVVRKHREFCLEGNKRPLFYRNREISYGEVSIPQEFGVSPLFPLGTLRFLWGPLTEGLTVFPESAIHSLQEKMETSWEGPWSREHISRGWSLPWEIRWKLWLLPRT